MRNWPFHSKETSSFSDLYKWLNQNGYCGSDDEETRGKNSNLSHNMLNSGKLYIPDHAYETFLAFLADDYERGNFWALSENIYPDSFPLFMDVDAKEALDEALVDELLYQYHSLLFEYFPNIQSVETTVCEKPRGERRCGLHIVTPDVITNQRNAIQFIRHLQLQMLSLHQEDVYRDIQWLHMIDRAVYSNGLRMCYTYKAHPCPFCKKAREEVRQKKKRRTVQEKNLLKEIEGHKQKRAKKKDITLNDLQDIGVEARYLDAQHFPRRLGSGYENNETFWKLVERYLRNLNPILAERIPKYPECTVCVSQGSLFEESWYEPFYTLTYHRGLLEPIEYREYQTPMTQLNVLDGLRLTYLRRSNCLPSDFNQIKVIPNELIALEEKRNKNAVLDTKAARRSKRAKLVEMDDDGKAVEYSEIDQITDPADPRWIMVARCIKELTQYSNVEIDSIRMYTYKHKVQQTQKILTQKMKRATAFVETYGRNVQLHPRHFEILSSQERIYPASISVLVSGDGSHYCNNKKGDHTNNRIRLELKGDGNCYQRCFSAKIPEGSAICCTDYSFPVGRIDPHDVVQLFPKPMIEHLTSTHSRSTNNYMNGFMLKQVGDYHLVHTVVQFYRDMLKEYEIQSTIATTALLTNQATQESSSSSSSSSQHMVLEEPEAEDDEL